MQSKHYIYLQSLSELYEEDFLKQTAGAVEETEMTKEHQEVAKLFRKICFKLNALAHAQFAPTRVRDEIEIKKVKDVAAIQMEEILPMAVSDAQRLAPEVSRITFIVVEGRSKFFSFLGNLRKR